MYEDFAERMALLNVLNSPPEQFYFIIYLLSRNVEKLDFDRILHPSAFIHIGNREAWNFVIVGAPLKEGKTRFARLQVLLGAAVLLSPLYNCQFSKQIMVTLTVTHTMLGASPIHESIVVRTNLSTVSADDIHLRLIRQGQSQPWQSESPN